MLKSQYFSNKTTKKSLYINGVKLQTFLVSCYIILLISFFLSLSWLSLSSLLSHLSHISLLSSLLSFLTYPLSHIALSPTTPSHPSFFLSLSPSQPTLTHGLSFSPSQPTLTHDATNQNHQETTPSPPKIGNNLSYGEIVCGGWRWRVVVVEIIGGVLGSWVVGCGLWVMGSWVAGC